MRTHTPGPWKDILEGYDYVVRSEGGQGYRVLSIRTGVIPSPPDARLIAAAPEMKDALMVLCEMKAGRCTSCGCEIADEGYCGCSPDENDPVTYDARCAARALLKRINGEG